MGQILSQSEQIKCSQQASTCKNQHQKLKSIRKQTKQILKSKFIDYEGLQIDNLRVKNNVQYYQNIIMRVLSQNNRNLIQNILYSQKQLTMNKKMQYLQKIGKIDIQSVDLIFQKKSNYFQKSTGDKCRRISIQNSNNLFQKYQYKNFGQIIDKKAEQRKNYKNYSQITNYGNNILQKQNKVAFLIMAGGISSRFTKDLVPNNLDKLYYSLEGSKCLLQIILTKFTILCSQSAYPIYIIYRAQKNKQIKQIISRNQFEKLQIYLVEQKQFPIVGQFGKLLLKQSYEQQKSLPILTAPCGVGDFLQFNVEVSKGSNIKLANHLDMKKIEYLCCLGANNILQQIFDPYMLGILANSRNLEGKNKKNIIFKLTYPQSIEQNQLRVVWNKHNQNLEIKNYDDLKKLNASNNTQVLEKSLIYINNLIFHIPSINQLKAQYITSQFYQTKQIYAQVYIPYQKKCQIQKCFYFQRTIQNTFFNTNMKCSSVGLLVSRDQNYAPVTTIQQHNSWNDAFQQYKNVNKINNSLYGVDDTVGIFHAGSLVSMENINNDNYM